jgi:hypothetical protein
VLIHQIKTKQSTGNPPYSIPPYSSVQRRQGSGAVADCGGATANSGGGRIAARCDLLATANHSGVTPEQAGQFVLAAYHGLCPAPGGSYDYWAYSTG